jgi:hypothetical protein
LTRAALYSVLALAKHLGQAVPKVPHEADITGPQAIEIIGEVSRTCSPG